MKLAKVLLFLIVIIGVIFVSFFGALYLAIRLTSVNFQDYQKLVLDDQYQKTISSGLQYDKERLNNELQTCYTKNINMLMPSVTPTDMPQPYTNSTPQSFDGQTGQYVSPLGE